MNAPATVMGTQSSNMLARPLALRLAGDDVEEMPVLELAARRGAVIFLFAQVLHVQRSKQRIDAAAGEKGDAGIADPSVPLAEQLA